nr:MAG TPA: hypothetical protein [Caudoviricetes sp.]
MLITMSITIEEAGEVEARRVAAALAAALAPAKPVEAKPEPKAAKPVEAKPEPKAAKPVEAKPEPKAAKPAEAGDDPTEDELLDQAALHAVALMQAGMTGSVREALAAVGARRVSQIKGVDNLQKFISLLPEAPTSEDA